jgi:hypothetical protein
MELCCIQVTSSFSSARMVEVRHRQFELMSHQHPLAAEGDAEMITSHEMGFGSISF